MRSASPDRRRGTTTRLRAAGFWIAFVTTGFGGIKLVDHIVGLSTEWVDAAIAVPRNTTHR